MQRLALSLALLLTCGAVSAEQIKPAVKAAAKKLGVTVKEVYWTVGHYDVVFVLEGDDEAVTSTLLKIGSLGNVRTETLRAFSAADMGRILANV